MKKNRFAKYGEEELYENVGRVPLSPNDSKPELEKPFYKKPDSSNRMNDVLDRLKEKDSYENGEYKMVQDKVEPGRRSDNLTERFNRLKKLARDKGLGK